MATTNEVTTSYAGQYAGEIISQALMQANTLESGIVTLKPNVKYRSILKRLSTGSLLAADGCDFDASSSITLDERVLEVKMLKVNLQVCKADFEDDYLALEMGDSANKNLPGSFATYLLDYVKKRVALEIEIAIYQGDGGATTIEGFESLFAADAEVIDVAASAITAANVAEELSKVVNAIPTVQYTNPNMQIIVSSGIMRAYVESLGGFGAAGLGAAGTDNKGFQWYAGQPLTFGGIKLVVANGISEGKMIATPTDNLYFGTSLMSDMNEVNVIDMKDIDLSQNVRMGLRLSAGVQYSFGGDVVFYS